MGPATIVKLPAQRSPPTACAARRRGAEAGEAAERAVLDGAASASAFAIIRAVTVHRGAIRALVVGVGLVALYTFFFLYPGHDPQPNGLPVGVVGPTDATERIAAELRRDGSFEVHRFADEAAARDAILDRDVYGAIAPGPRPRVYVATAASFQVAQLLREVASTVVAEPRLRVVDVRPLHAGDPRGASLNLLVLGVTVPAILGALVLMQMAPGLDGRARLAVLAVLSLLSAIAAVLVARVGIGVIGGSVLALTGVLALGIFAIAAPSLALILAMGPAGVGVAFLMLLMLGNPASGAASAPELLPDPWSWAGQLLPPGAIATGARNVAYFEAAGAVLWLGVLLAYAIVSAGLVLLLSTRRTRTREAA